MQHRAVLMISGALALTPALAWGQDAPPPPPPPSVGDPIVAGTGAGVIDRGLILPAQKSELEAGFYLFSAGQLDPFDIVDLVVAGRYSFGTAEVFGGAELVVIQPGEDDDDTPTDLDVLQFAHLGARVAAGSGDVRLRAATVGSDDNLTWLELDGGYEMKRKVNQQVAWIAGGGAVFHLLMIEFAGEEESAHSLYLYGRGAGQFQATPEIAVEAGLQLAIPTIHGDSGDGDSDDNPWETVFKLHAEGIYSIGKLDIFARGEIHRDRFVFPSQAGPASLDGGVSLTGFMIGVRAYP